MFTSMRNKPLPDDLHRFSKHGHSPGLDDSIEQIADCRIACELGGGIGPTALNPNGQFPQIRRLPLDAGDLMDQLPRDFNALGNSQEGAVLLGYVYTFYWVTAGSNIPCQSGSGKSFEVVGISSVVNNNSSQIGVTPQVDEGPGDRLPIARCRRKSKIRSDECLRAFDEVANTRGDQARREYEKIVTCSYRPIYPGETQKFHEVSPNIQQKCCNSYRNG